MRLGVRPYQTEDDYWRMRAFLREVFGLNGRLERSWHVARLDYAHWHGALNCAKMGFEAVSILWEVGDRLAAFLISDGGLGDAHFCIHPAYETPALEEAMLVVAEERLPALQADGRRKLYVWAPEADLARQDLFRRHGYREDDWPETQWRRDLNETPPPAPMPAGYTLRALGDGLELLERCYASGLGFHQGDLHIAADNRADPSWYRNIQTAPLYRRDLDLVAVDAYGAIASFCTIWFDDVTRSAMFEPVATVPQHQRRGLGRALLTEGLRRLQRIGATRAFVSGHSAAANGLYCTVMGPAHEVNQVWVKEWLA
jgi:mycothiol synthase